MTGFSLGLGLGLGSRASGGGTPPGPVLPSGLVADFDPSTIPAQSDNTALASWTDSVGGVVFTASTAPKYRTVLANGGPCVEFDGTSSLLCALANLGAIGTAISSGEYSIFIATDNATQTTGNVGSIFTSNTNAGGKFNMIQNNTNFGTSTGVSGGRTIPFSGGGYLSFGLTCTLAYPYGGSSASRCRYYGRGMIVANTGTVNVNISDGLGIGSTGTNGSSRFKGRIWRILAFNRRLTPAEAWQVETVFNTKYGQTHPAVTKGKLLIIDGDSRMCGVSGDNTTINTQYYQIAQGLGYTQIGTWTNPAIGGLTIANCLAKAPEDIYTIPAMLPTVSLRYMYEESFNSIHNTHQTLVSCQSGTHSLLQGVRAALGASAKIVVGTPFDQQDQTAGGYPTSVTGGGDWIATVNAEWSVPSPNNLWGYPDALADQWLDPVIGGGHYAANAALWGDGVHLVSSAQTTYQAPIWVAAAQTISGF